MGSGLFSGHPPPFAVRSRPRAACSDRRRASRRRWVENTPLSPVGFRRCSRRCGAPPGAGRPGRRRSPARRDRCPDHVPELETHRRRARRPARCTGAGRQRVDAAGAPVGHRRPIPLVDRRAVGIDRAEEAAAFEVGAHDGRLKDLLRDFVSSPEARDGDGTCVAPTPEISTELGPGGLAPARPAAIRFSCQHGRTESADAQEFNGRPPATG